MEKILKYIYRKIIYILPMKLALYLIYFRGYKKILNLRAPKYYGEKIQWLKLYGELEKLSSFTDKYEVRKYIKTTIGEEYLVDILGIFDNVDDINFSLLPNEFVLKCTNGSQAVIICKDKRTFDELKAKKIMNKWLKTNYFKQKKEKQYKEIKNRIIVEKYMEDESGGLRDYKFYCYNGNPKFFTIYSNRFKEIIVDTFDINGNFLDDCKKMGKRTRRSIHPTIPRGHLLKLIELSKKLSKKFTFVRVDFYIVEDKIYFGELTFTEGAGSDAIYPLEKYDLAFAEDIVLTKVLRSDY